MNQNPREFPDDQESLKEQHGERWAPPFRDLPHRAKHLAAEEMARCLDAESSFTVQPPTLLQMLNSHTPEQVAHILTSDPKRIPTIESQIQHILEETWDEYYYAIGFHFLPEQEETCDALITWAKDHVVPALRSIAENSSDTEAMLELGKKLPPDLQEPWPAFIQQTLERATQESKEFDRSEEQQEAFFYAVRDDINRMLLAPRRVLLSSLQPRHLIDEKNCTRWDGLRLGVFKIIRERCYRFSDMQIPVLFVELRSDEEHKQNSIPHYNRRTKQVIMPLDTLSFEQWLLKGIIEGHPAIKKERGIKHWLLRQTFNSYAHFIRSQYEEDNDQDILHDFIDRTLNEELRHAVDWNRCSSVSTHLTELENRDHFVRSLLKPSGQLMAFYNSCTSDEERYCFAKAMSELSAKMTAAAVSRNHSIVLAEWERDCDFFFTAKYDAFEGVMTEADTARYGVLLLAQECGLTPPLELRETPRNFREKVSRGWRILRRQWSKIPQSLENPDSVVVTALSDLLLKLPADRIRLGLKNIRNREMNVAIDEYPFRGIDDSGTLIRRKKC